MVTPQIQMQKQSDNLDNWSIWTLKKLNTAFVQRKTLGQPITYVGNVYYTDLQFLPSKYGLKRGFSKRVKRTQRTVPWDSFDAIIFFYIIYSNFVKFISSRLLNK